MSLVPDRKALKAPSIALTRKKKEKAPLCLRNNMRQAVTESLCGYYGYSISASSSIIHTKLQKKAYVWRPLRDS